jgi:UDP-N-acetylmuramoylalanine--D-glutamate ligase
VNIFDKKKVFVLGLAKSGRAVAGLLASRGFAVRVWDDDAKAVRACVDAGDFAAEAGRDLDVATKDNRYTLLDECDCLVISPGVPLNHPLVMRAGTRGIDVAGELEVACQFTAARIVGITGTNGKSTVTDLVGSILDTAGMNAVVAGNIGTPLSSIIAAGIEAETLVLEISSFQLDTVDRFKADIAVLLNVTPDHLDRYGDSFEAYARSKRRILNRADERTFFVHNHEDAVCRAAAAETAGIAMPFSSARALPAGAFTRDDQLVRIWGGEETVFLRRKEFMPVGLHNLENALAAIAAVTPLNVEREALVQALKQYRPLPHRMELVQVVGGVAYIDDSKATNVDAAAKSLQSIGGGVILILGGRDKNGDFTTLYPFLKNVKSVVLIGEAAEKIESVLEGRCPLARAGSMEDAVTKASAVASPGDTVLLAPACASFDMFVDYKERGDVFRRCVKRIPV